MIIFFIGVWRNLRAYISIRGHRLQMSVGTLTYTNLYFKTDSGYNRIECAFLWVRHLDDFQMSTLISAFQMSTPSIIWSVFITSF